MFDNVILFVKNLPRSQNSEMYAVLTSKHVEKFRQYVHGLLNCLNIQRRTVKEILRLKISSNFL